MSKVVVISRTGEASMPPTVRHALAVQHDVTFVRRQAAPSATEAARLLRDADVLASTNVTLPRLDGAVLDALPRLRHVVLYATGYEHIDVAELDARGVTLSTLPDYATNAVAEHALALLLSSAARVHLANDRARGQVPAEVSLRGVEITSRTVAVIGLGRIGRRLAQLCHGLGMRVVGVDVDESARRRARQAGVPVLDRDAALDEADLVAVCASTVEGLYPVLDRAALARLHEDAFVVNVGRPVLVDSDAVRCALHTRRLRGYAVDEIVLDPQDPGDAQLLSEGRVLQTAHSAWWRDEVLARGAHHFATAIQAAADGAPIHVVGSAAHRVLEAV